jgi:hypothetical protein
MMIYQFLSTINAVQRYSILTACCLKPSTIYNFDEDEGLIFINLNGAPSRLTKENFYNMLSTEYKKIWNGLFYTSP